MPLRHPLSSVCRDFAHQRRFHGGDDRGVAFDHDRGAPELCDRMDHRLPAAGTSSVSQTHQRHGKRGGIPRLYQLHRRLGNHAVAFERGMETDRIVV